MTIYEMEKSVDGSNSRLNAVGKMITKHEIRVIEYPNWNKFFKSWKKILLISVICGTLIKQSNKCVFGFLKEEREKLRKKIYLKTNSHKVPSCWKISAHRSKKLNKLWAGNHVEKPQLHIP